MVRFWQENLRQQQEALKAKVILFWQARFAPRYAGLQASEQRLLLIAAVVLPLILFIFGLVLPVFDKHRLLQEDVSNIALELQQAKQLAALVLVQPQSSSHTAKNSNQLLTLVDQLAREAGVRRFMTRLRPQQIMGKQGRLQAQMKAVPYAKVLIFIGALADNNLALPTLKIQAVSPGVVHVQAVIVSL